MGWVGFRRDLDVTEGPPVARPLTHLLLMKQREFSVATSPLLSMPQRKATTASSTVVEK